MPSPSLIFGAATLGSGGFSCISEVDAVLEILKSLGVSRIDTAARYSGGASEKLLGQAATGEKYSFEIDTKILFTGDGSGTLTKEAIEKSIKSSIERLQIKNISTLYIHAPDPSTPILTSLTALTAQHHSGYFTRLGLSNFTVSQVEEWHMLATQHGLIVPSVYQGQYNLLARECETFTSTPRKPISGRNCEPGMLPTLRRLGFQLNAHSPLAWGVLTGKMLRIHDGEDNEALEGSRLAEGNPAGRMVRTLYGARHIDDALSKLKSVCDAHGVGLAECSLRWLIWHSRLEEYDGVILGASKVGQVIDNVAAIRKGALNAELLRACEELREDVEIGEREASA